MRRLIYYENPHLFEEVERRAIIEDIALRRRGEGKYAAAPWTTIARALAELENMADGAPDAFKLALRDLQ